MELSNTSAAWCPLLADRGTVEDLNDLELNAIKEGKEPNLQRHTDDPDETTSTNENFDHDDYVSESLASFLKQTSSTLQSAKLEFVAASRMASTKTTAHDDDWDEDDDDDKLCIMTEEDILKELPQPVKTMQVDVEEDEDGSADETFWDSRSRGTNSVSSKASIADQEWLDAAEDNETLERAVHIQLPHDSIPSECCGIKDCFHKVEEHTRIEEEGLAISNKIIKSTTDGKPAPKVRWVDQTRNRPLRVNEIHQCLPKTLKTVQVRLEQPAVTERQCKNKRQEKSAAASSRLGILRNARKTFRQGLFVTKLPMGMPLVPGTNMLRK